MKILIQHMIPQHFLSRLMHRFMRIRIRFIKNIQISFVKKNYNVDMAEALNDDALSYKTFNDFFTRELKAAARPICPGNTLSSPADGMISAFGTIKEGRMIQAKGHYYTVSDLLADNNNSAQFNNGEFVTIYLSPRDYHRVHMPIRGKLKKMIYIPGKLFSVNNLTANNVDNLFARNERVVCHFDTEIGNVISILVGAIFVGSMQTVWAGKITPPYQKEIKIEQYKDGVVLEKGDEMGRFNMGSTVILLLPEGKIRWSDEVKEDVVTKVGQQLASFIT